METIREQLGDDTLAWIPPPSVRAVRYDPATGQAYDPDCRFGPASPYQDAYVRADHYLDVGRCPGGLYRWLDALWGTLDPRSVRPLSGGGNRRR